LENIKEKKNEIKENEKELIDLEVEKDTNKRLIADYKNKAKSSEKKKSLLNLFNSLEQDVRDAELNKENYFRQFISDLLSQSIFSVSKISEDTDVKNNLESHKANLKSLISRRKVETNIDLDEKEQEMIMSLEKSQPKPEILQQMADIDHCFVCNHELNEKSKKYILEKLIPFFNSDGEDDQELNKFVEIHDLIRNIELESSRYFNQDLDYFNK